MPSPQRGSLSPRNPAELLAPNADYQDRPVALGLGSPTHFSQHSHMSRGGPGLYANMNVNALSSNSNRGPKPTAEDNVPNRFDTFLLGDGEKKVAEDADTRIPSASTFTFNKEDHTLGNLLRSHLLKSPHVRYSGYRIPHPLNRQVYPLKKTHPKQVMFANAPGLASTFELRIQTDGTRTPRAALQQTCRELVNDLSILSREFTKEWELRKMVGDGAKGDEKDGKGKGPGR